MMMYSWISLDVAKWGEAYLVILVDHILKLIDLGQ